MINWATDVKMWPRMWPSLLPGQKPNQFWYFYPTFEVWNVEFQTKWVPDFLPRGEMKNDPIFGWKDNWDKNHISSIEFNSGVTIFCKAYAQKIKDLQSGSCHAIGLDEECVEEFMPEILARLRATNGYLRAVFTATIGQEYWRKVMEPISKDEEMFPEAWKKQISLYDCQTYIDGTKSRWTDDRIQEIIDECPTDADVKRRVFGRFVKSEGLRFESFDLKRNRSESKEVPDNWARYAGVDPGSGGNAGHPAAMVFIAANPTYTGGRIYRARRMDGIPTTSQDILNEYRLMRGKDKVHAAVYDYKDRDFYLVAQGQGENFRPANKNREEGYGLLNTLFKTGMLTIDKGDPELEKLVEEILTLDLNPDKRKKKDDLCDAVRYTVLEIPWNFEATIMNQPKKEPPKELTPEEEILAARRNFALNKSDKPTDDYEQEINFWNELMGTND